MTSWRDNAGSYDSPSSQDYVNPARRLYLDECDRQQVASRNTMPERCANHVKATISSAYYDPNVTRCGYCGVEIEEA